LLKYKDNEREEREEPEREQESGARERRDREVSCNYIKISISKNILSLL
jgi:hypothetical protein